MNFLGACPRIGFLCQGKAKLGEKAEFIGINEHFEPNFNAAMVQKNILGHAPSQTLAYHVFLIAFSKFKEKQIE